ncbi:Rha family transcriptional regulator, partial [Weissella bombi]
MTQTEQLVELQNGVATTTSLEVAKIFGKKHRNILKIIDDIINEGLLNIEQTLKNKAMAYFELSSYKNEQNHQTYRMYKMNYKGFTLLAGGFTDKKFMEYKVMFVEQFDAMQHYIQEQQQTQFFAPETVEQQIKREQLAIAKQNSDNAKSREVRSWLKLTKNDPEAVKMAAPKVMSILLDV